MVWSDLYHIFFSFLTFSLVVHYIFSRWFSLIVLTHISHVCQFILFFFSTFPISTYFFNISIISQSLIVYFWFYLTHWEFHYIWTIYTEIYTWYLYVIYGIKCVIITRDTLLCFSGQRLEVPQALHMLVRHMALQQYQVL